MDGILDRSPKLCRWLAGLLILAAALLRLAYLAWFSPLDLAPDEAHYWDWSRHLDWSYYSKGPLVALIIRASLTVFGPMSIALTGGETFAVRIPAVIFGSLLLVGLYALSTQVFGREKWSLATVAITLTFPVVSAGSSLMTIDAPFMCLWTWALVAGHRAFVGRSTWAWAATGVVLALGILAKHTMVLWIPCFGLFLLCTPSVRPLLRSGGFWTMIAIAGLGVLPILGWNAANGWVTLLHTQGHVGVSSPRLIHWFGPAFYFGLQFALLLGFWFIVWVRGMWAHRPWADARPESRFLWWMSMPTFLFFGLFALKNHGGEPNWPLAAYLSGMVLAARWLREQMSHPVEWWRIWSRVSTIGVAAIGLLVTLALHQPIVMQPMLMSLADPATEQHPMPMRRVDPTLRLRGWRHLADEVDRARADLRAQSIDPIIATERWTQAGELGFYCEGNPKIYCMGLFLGDRDSQYDLWRPNPLRDPAAFRGRTFVLVGVDVERLRPLFGKTEAARSVHYHEADQMVAAWTIVIAHDFLGANSAPGSAPLRAIP